MGLRKRMIFIYWLLIPTVLLMLEWWIRWNRGKGKKKNKSKSKKKNKKKMKNRNKKKSKNKNKMMLNRLNKWRKIRWVNKMIVIK